MLINLSGSAGKKPHKHIKAHSNIINTHTHTLYTKSTIKIQMICVDLTLLFSLFMFGFVLLFRIANFFPSFVAHLFIQYDIALHMQVFFAVDFDIVCVLSHSI